MSNVISLPHLWHPRHYQKDVFEYFQKGGKRAVTIWHRRAGKDLTAINLIAWMAFNRVGTYVHLFPEYSQGRRVIWDGKDNNGRPFIDAFPEELVDRKVDRDMKIFLKPPPGSPHKVGSVYQVGGVDNVDSLRGSNFVGIVLSEYGDYEDVTTLHTVIDPILRMNGGWAWYLYTPKGKNHGYSLYSESIRNPSWYTQLLTIDDTYDDNGNPLVTKREVEEDVQMGKITETEMMQEYFCSFEAAVTGSYYGSQMDWLTKEKKITKVPWEPCLLVHTAWDLGLDDSTSIWFFQIAGEEVRLIDHYRNNSEPLGHYAKIIKEKPYTYGTHLAPFDMKFREMVSGGTRLEYMTSLGLRMTVVPQRSVADGLQNVRTLLPRCRFDADNCKHGIESLINYKRKWNKKTNSFSETPLHDEFSDDADAFRTLANGIRLIPECSFFRPKQDSLPRRVKMNYDVFEESSYFL